MMTFRDDALKDVIEAGIGLCPPFATEAFTGQAGDIRQSVARIKASAFIPRKDDVQGFVYDCATGRLQETVAG